MLCDFCLKTEGDGAIVTGRVCHSIDCNKTITTSAKNGYVYCLSCAKKSDMCRMCGEPLTTKSKDDKL